ncbi:MAG: arsenate reductase [Acidimicrobiia bacterium]|nr:arsenate reductase [Acidimicrobiia bacterium]
MAVATEMGIDFDDVRYLKNPPDRATLERIVAVLEDPVEDLVRKDSTFEKLGLEANSFVGDAKAVIDTLVEHPKLLQRPVLVRGDRAIIGRPKDRVPAFLS